MSEKKNKGTVHMHLPMTYTSTPQHVYYGQYYYSNPNEFPKVNEHRRQCRSSLRTSTDHYYHYDHPASPYVVPPNVHPHPPHYPYHHHPNFSPSMEPIPCTEANQPEHSHGIYNAFSPPQYCHDFEPPSEDDDASTSATSSASS